MKKKVVIVVGSTGSGKSDLALALAKEFNGYLIGADSRQLYKGMDIGTNKDPAVWQEGKLLWDGVEEYLIDIINPDESFTLDDWLKQTKEIINKNEKTPIIVGGTGLYTTALVHGYELQGGLDERLRIKLEKILEKKGVEALLKKIKKIDPEIEDKIDISNPRRVLRAAEICLSTKKPLDFNKKQSEYEFLQIGLEIDRKSLYERLNKRAEVQFERGLVEEVKDLLDKGYDRKSPALSGIGYRQVIRYLDGEISKEEAIELNKRDNRRYAKRQMTWYKREKDIKWLAQNLNGVNGSGVRNLEEARELVKYFLK